MDLTSDDAMIALFKQGTIHAYFTFDYSNQAVASVG
jgi:hypothetical protein